MAIGRPPKSPELRFWPNVDSSGGLTRSCVRLEHLRLLTPAENKRLSTSPSADNARKTHCLRGHEFTPANTYTPTTGGRYCRACWAVRYEARAKKEAPAVTGAQVAKGG